jgi:hypothetical protein
MFILGSGGHPTIRRTNDRMGMPGAAVMGGERTFPQVQSLHAMKTKPISSYDDRDGHHH